MNILQEERKGLADSVREILGDVKVFDHIPEAFTPPSALVVPGAPYIDEGSSFNCLTANFEVWLVAKKGSNEKETNFIDEKLIPLITELLIRGWTVIGVDEPFMYGPEGAGQTLTVILRVSTEIKFQTNPS